MHCFSILLTDLGDTHHSQPKYFLCAAVREILLKKDADDVTPFLKDYWWLSVASGSKLLNLRTHMIIRHSISNLYLDSSYQPPFQPPLPHLQTPPATTPPTMTINAPWGIPGTGNGLSCLCPCTLPSQAKLTLLCIPYLTKSFLLPPVQKLSQLS